MLSRILRNITCFALAMAVALPAMTKAAEAARTFSTPEEAVKVLSDAVNSQNRDSLRAIFGDGLEEIANPDRVQATNEFEAFAAALQEGTTLTSESPTRRILEVGANNWPFPIPIVGDKGRWVF